MQERKYTRVSFQTKAILQGNTATMEGKVKNLALGGIFLTSQGPPQIPIGEEVVLSVMIEGKSTMLTIRAHGKVLRHQGSGLAVQFDIKKFELDSLSLLKTVVLTNGGDPEKVEREYNKILKLIS